nr:MAG TPA: hypothetical protein [Caudoviricetes sp.]
MKIIEKIKYELYGKKVEKKEAQIARYRKWEEECKQAEDEMYELVKEKLDLKDNIEFIEKYCQAARKDYYRHERINLESNTVERSKEEDINVKLVYYYAGMYTVVGVLAIGIWLRDRK